MNQFALILALIALAVVPNAGSAGVLRLAPSGGETTWLTLPEALADAQASQRPALVYVQAAWCGPCRRLERDTFADPAVRARLGRFALARLTFDDRDRQHRIGDYRLSEAEWAARLGAEATPTLIWLTPDGAVLGHHTGYLPPEGLLPVLDAALGRPAR